MERKSYTQQEINMILQELAGGRTMEETAKAHDVSRATLYEAALEIQALKEQLKQRG